MTSGLVRTIAIATAIAATLSVSPAIAQGRDFYVQQYSSAIRDFNKAIDRVNGIKTEKKAEKDFVRGCSLLAGLSYNLQNAQTLAERVAGYASQLDDDDGRRAAEQAGTLQEERQYWDGERSRLCR